MDHFVAEPKIIIKITQVLGSPIRAEAQSVPSAEQMNYAYKAIYNSVVNIQSCHPDPAKGFTYYNND